VAVERYARLLAGAGIERGLLGPNEVARIWDRHLLNSAALAELAPRPCALVDVGSGGGLPGVVLGLMLPDCQVTLVEPLLRRSEFLTECVSTLGLANTTVCRARAEDLTGALTADVVTARAVAPLAKLVGWTWGLLRPGGILLAVKGACAEEELRAARPVLRRLGARDAAVLRVGGGRVDPAVTVVRVVKSR
jgi:16S rRNA (guanine527-N7)-methyltransferase